MFLLTTSFVLYNGLTYIRISTCKTSYTKKLQFVLDELATDYHSHYHAFSITPSIISQVGSLHNLPFLYVFHLRYKFSDNKLFISYKYT